MNEFDDTDRRLMALLQEDGRQSLATLSGRLGAPASTLNDRIKRLVRSGAITGFHAHLDHERLGLDLLAFVYVGWSEPSVEPQFLQRVAETPCILECHHITGAWNYLLKVRLRSTRELERFLADVVKDTPGVQRTETIIVLSSSKETHVLDTSPRSA